MSSARARAFPANEAARVFCAAEYGWYSHVNRGKRRKTPGEDPSTIEEVNAVSRSTAKRAWARLITQVYAVDPLICARCGSAMRILAVIEQLEVIAKILAHLGLCSALSQSKGPTRVHSPPVEAVAA